MDVTPSRVRLRYLEITKSIFSRSSQAYAFSFRESWNFIRADFEPRLSLEAVSFR